MRGGVAGWGRICILLASAPKLWSAAEFMDKHGSLARLCPAARLVASADRAE